MLPQLLWFVEVGSGRDFFAQWIITLLLHFLSSVADSTCPRRRRIFSSVGTAVPKLSQNSRIVGNSGTMIVGAGFIPARLAGL